MDFKLEKDFWRRARNDNQAICHLERVSSSQSSRDRKFTALCRWHRVEIIGGIEVRGEAAFIERTRAALALLGSGSQAEFVRLHIAIIRQGRRSGMKAWAEKPTFRVGKPTWSHSPLWYAGAIAHDAYHSHLYRESRRANGGKEPRPQDWTGAGAEKQCLAFQRQVLTALNAGAATIAYIEDCARNPSYQGRSQGWQSWLDYLRRRW